jgi:hypothetical protein
MPRKTLDQIKAERRARADALKAMDLNVVCDKLGGDPEPEGKGGLLRWKFGAVGAGRTHRILVHPDGLWGCSVTGRGGRGAIGLVMEVEELDFNGAFKFLDGIDKGETGVVREARPRAVPVKVERDLEMPDRLPERWTSVRRHLIETRGISAETVDALAERGDLYATERRLESGKIMINVVMVLRDAAGEVRGAEVKGTFKPAEGRRFSSLAAGSSKAEARFIAGEDIAEADIVMVVESGVDAMAGLDHLRGRHPGRRIAVISSAGDGDIPEAILAKIAPGALRLGGQDRDAAGEALFARLGEGWERLAPPGPGKDWADWTEFKLIEARREAEARAAEAEARRARREAWEAEKIARAKAWVPDEPDEVWGRRHADALERVAAPHGRQFEKKGVER